MWRIKKADSFKEFIHFEKFMIVSFNKEINIIDLNKRQVKVLENGSASINFLKVDEVTRRVYAGVGGEIKCWDIDSGKCLKKLKRGSTYLDAIETEGDVLYLGNCNKIEIWNLKEEKLCRKLEHSEGWICHIQRGGSHIFALTATELMIWNSKTGELLSKIGKVDGPNFKVFENLLFVCKEQKVAVYSLLDIRNPQELVEIPCQFDENYRVQLIGNLFFISSHRIAGNVTEIWNIAHAYQGKVTLLHRLYNTENLISGLIEHRHVTYDMHKGSWFELWEYDLPFLSYSQIQLQRGFQILAAMAEYAGKKKWKECDKLRGELDKEFTKRLEVHFGVLPSFAGISKEDISHVTIEICIDVMLYAAYEENWMKMATFLEVFENSNKKLANMLYALLFKECGKKKDSDWGKKAFHRICGYSAPKHRIIAAIFCFQEKLYAKRRLK